MFYSKVVKKDFNEWVKMAKALWADWPAGDAGGLKKEFRRILDSKKDIGIICRNIAEETAGFVDGSIRVDYVEGAESSPVGYIESIYVKPKFRRHGIAKHLIKLVERWAEGIGCKELGSDADLSNLNSRKFHKKLGFKKAGHIAHFIKKIN